MHNNPDPQFDRYADLDFADAQPVAAVPALAKLQTEHGEKSCIKIRVDNETLADALRETIRQKLRET